MKLTKTIASALANGYCVLVNKIIFRRCSFYVKPRLPRNHRNIYLLTTNEIQNYSISFNKRFVHTDENNGYDEELSNNADDVYTELYQQPQSIRSTLYPNSDDVLIRKLNDSASLQDVLTFITSHLNELNTNHVTQIILVLWDLQNMFYHVSLSSTISYMDISKFDKLNEDYINNLKRDEIYTLLLKLLQDKHQEFNTEQLSYILKYLKKMGFSCKETIMQTLISNFQSKFVEHTSLATLTRYMSAIFVKRDLSFYYNIQEFIPSIIDNIDKCCNAEELNVVTLCLNNINSIVTDDSLVKYKKKVDELWASNIINVKEYKAVLNIMLLLNFPQWRERNANLIIRCMSLLKDNLHLLKVKELLTVYEVFFQIQEPGDILNELQRCAYKYLVQLEEEMSPLLDIRLKLFSCIVYFATPLQRPHFKKVIENYVNYNLDGKSLLVLHNIIIYTKFSDNNLSDKYWKKVVSCFDNKDFVDAHLLRICKNYISFNEEISGCRCIEFEDKVLKILNYELKHGLMGLLPYQFSTIASFLLIYEQDRDTLDIVISKIVEFAEYFNHVDSINISYGLLVAMNKNKCITNDDASKIKTSLDKCTYKILQNDCGISKTNILLKSCIYRNCADKHLLDILWKGCLDKLNFYSMLLKNMSYNLYSTSTLCPDILNAMVDYVVQHKNNILSFNAERIVYLCFHLGFLPKDSAKFFETITDIFLRDQERMSGLSYLQACLSLCFFQTLPQSFIKQIFNVEFLEKLDLELENCYHKDVYPSRVRNHMMQLNRAVCLEYPESKVPWFHEKYVDTLRKNTNQFEDNFALNKSIKNCLVELTKNADCIKENEISPYGYHIDFVLNLDANIYAEKIAILIIKPHYYTNFHKQLKGIFQLKIRHLEILGYKVCPLNIADWKGLASVEDKINYLSNIVKYDEPCCNTVENG